MFKRLLLVSILFGISPFAQDANAAAPTKPSSPATSSTLGQERVTDTTGWYPFAYNLKDATLENIDLSGILEAPAGQHGFLTINSEGHFAFADGKRIRFFGTVLGGAQTSPDHKTAEIMAARLAKYGINMVRFHCPDAAYGQLIDYKKGSSRYFDAEALDRYDYLFAQFKKHGIYSYFDLLDYREFKPSDGIKDAAQMQSHWVRSMKAASMFDKRMLELQKEYATNLLTHKNPYTGLRYVDDPALAIQEITNENSLFYIQFGSLLLPSYMQDLRQLWNEWLLKKYNNRDGLVRAWTNEKGECALMANEDPANGSVTFPNTNLYADTSKEPFTGPKSPARLNSMTKFLYDLQVNYYKEMTSHLKSIGLKCPITGTNQDFSDASNAANGVCEATTRNNYWCLSNASSGKVNYINDPMVRSNIAKRANPIANVASSTVNGKPMLMPELNFPWPNEWRAECLPLMASYAMLQDWDGLLYFNYAADANALTSFPNGSDPVRWGEVPLAALIFHRGDISAARNSIDVGVSSTDLYAARPQRTSDTYSPYRILPFISKVRNFYFDSQYNGNADVAISSGHSAGGDYSKAKHAIVFADSPAIDPLGIKKDRGLSARQTAPNLKTSSTNEKFDTEIDSASLPQGSKSITEAQRVVGFINDKQMIYPAATALEEKDPYWLHRMFLQAAKQWNLPSAAPVEEAGKIFRSDTGELVLNSQQGIFTANADRVAMITGFIGKQNEVNAGKLTVRSKIPFASISAIALDDQPLSSSKKILLTVVARAENTGQVAAAHAVKNGPAKVQDFDADRGTVFTEGRNVLVKLGHLPVLVEPVDSDVQLQTSTKLHAYPLSPNGSKMKELPSEYESEVLSLNTKNAHSPWILLIEE